MESVPLSSLLLTIAQGLPTQRYEVKEGGERFYVIQTRQMDRLHVSDDLPEVVLKGEKLERHRLPPGTLLVANRTWPVKASVVTSQAAGAIAGQNLAILTLKPDVNPVFLAGLLRSEFMAERLGMRAASGQPMLSLRQLGDVQIPFPVPEQQALFAALFTDREVADELARRSIEQRQRVIEAALDQHLNI